MNRLTFPVEGISIITLKSHGDLHLSAGNFNEITVFSDVEELKTSRQNDEMVFKTHDDLDIQIPNSLVLKIEKIYGDAFLQGVEGVVQIETVAGDMFVRNFKAGLRVSNLGGDCTLNEIGGDVKIERIGGDLFGEGISGGVESRVGGSVMVQAGGPLNIRAGGDIGLHLTSAKPANLKAGGDIALHLPANMDANVELESGGEQILVHVGSHQVDLQKWTYTAVVGAGGVLLQLDAGGDVEVVDTPWDRDEVDSQVSGMDETWREHQCQLDESLTEIADEAGDRFSQRAQHISEKAARISERAAQISERVARKMERHAERISRQVEGIQGQIPSDFAMPPIPPIPPIYPAQPETQKTGASEEERKIILQMLADKKITAEQAELLLQALE